MRHAAWFVPLFALAACAHKPAVKTADSAAPASANATVDRSSAPAVAVPTQAEGAPCTRDVECGSRQLCISAHCVNITNGLPECSELRVYFDYNSSLLREKDQPRLERSARCLRADHAMHLRIEGNTDERGTDEYNLALGDQRARAVAKYLEDLGVSESQLATISYGKEMPLCTEHDEACWGKNRRAQLNLAGAATGRGKN